MSLYIHQQGFVKSLTKRFMEVIPWLFRLIYPPKNKSLFATAALHLEVKHQVPKA